MCIFSFGFVLILIFVDYRAEVEEAKHNVGNNDQANTAETNFFMQIKSLPYVINIVTIVIILIDFLALSTVLWIIFSIFIPFQ